MESILGRWGECATQRPCRAGSGPDRRPVSCGGHRDSLYRHAHGAMGTGPGRAGTNHSMRVIAVCPRYPMVSIAPCTPALSAAPVLLCLSNCPDRASATRISRDLVERRLAACVNLLPGVESVYRWQGTVETGSEVMLLIKTTPRHLEAVTARIVALHPYELPEVIALESAGGLAGYLEWIASETSGDQPA